MFEVEVLLGEELGVDVEGERFDYAAHVDVVCVGGEGDEV